MALIVGIGRLNLIGLLADTNGEATHAEILSDI